MAIVVPQRLISIAAVFIVTVGTTHAFLTPPTQTRILQPSNTNERYYVTTNHVTTTTGFNTKLYMSSTTNANAMDSLSDSCIKAITYSQNSAHNLKLTELNNEILLVGMIRSAGAEDMNIRKILTAFGISPDGALQSVEDVLLERGVVKSSASSESSSEDESPPLPFSTATKQTLDDAISIANRMSNGVVLPGHVLLALLEYDERYSVATEDVSKCSALAVLKKTSANSPVGKQRRAKSAVFSKRHQRGGRGYDYAD